VVHLSPTRLIELEYEAKLETHSTKYDTVTLFKNEWRTDRSIDDKDRCANSICIMRDGEIPQCTC